jgi:hypothetical protein
MSQKNINREVSMEELHEIIIHVYKVLDKKNIYFSSATSNDAFYKELQGLLEKHFDFPDYQSHN